MSAAAMALPQASSTSLLPFDSVTHIDISTLSQSELHALSLFSSASFNRSDDLLVVPKIDPSQFNESAGSRRQTYSRLRRPQASEASTSHRRRVAGLLSNPKVSPPPAQPDDPERSENHAIIAHLKRFISQDPKFDQIDFQPTAAAATTAVTPSFAAESGARKRKRGRKPKVKGSAVAAGLSGGGGEGLGMHIVNKNGAAVDIWALKNSENPFGDELRRRTLGLESEEELLGFMRDLGGQWGSRRKRRKIVDATEFGDALPLGWKLLLGLKRKERRAWIYCRRYISPTGQQFLSSKEVASFLESFFGLYNTDRHDGDGSQNIQEDSIEASSNHADKEGERRQDVTSSTAILVSSVPNQQSNEPEKKVSLSKMENVAEVQIHNLFECHKCNMTFAEKDSYLQHLLSFHQRTTRRYRLGSTVGDGVIIKDGKYECQFCHKVFLERRRYNGHVGIHVRNYVRRVEESPAPTTLQKKIESPLREDLPSRNSKMDALIEIAQNSILETSTAGPNDGLKVGTTPDPFVSTSLEVPASTSHREMNIESILTEHDLDDLMIEGIIKPEQESEHTITNRSMEEAVGAREVVDAMEVIDVQMNSCLVTAALAAEEKNGKTSESSVEKNGLAFTSDEMQMSGTKQENASECHGVHDPSINQPISDLVDNVKCAGALDHPSAVEVNKQKHAEPIGGINQPQPANDSSLEVHASNINELHSGICDTSMSLVQPLLCLSTSNAIGQKGEEHLVSVDQRGDRVIALEDLQQHGIEHLKHGFAAQESGALNAALMDATDSSEMQITVGSAVQFEPEKLLLNMAGSQQLTTTCVWCGVEFRHEAVDYEVQPDSVGFMCPVCKAKISERE